MRCKVFAVPFSDNLGDGVIYECIKRGFEIADPTVEVSPVDISGRKGFSTRGGVRRARASSLLTWIPSWMGPLLVAAKFGVVSRRRLIRHLMHEATDLDFAIIGGGHILSSANLNFPIKLSLLAKRLEMKGRPVAIYAVGASQWGAAARRLMKSVFRSISLVSVSVRDEESRRYVTEGLGPVLEQDVGIVLDPALACSRLFPVSKSEKQPAGKSAFTVTVNVIGKQAIAIDRNNRSEPPPAGAEFYFRLILALIDRGYKVRLMTNGSHEDEELKRSIFERFRSGVFSEMVTEVRRPLHPVELISAISSSDALISHRLHANIIAYSYSIPSVGLVWDSKVASFFKQVGRSRFCLGASEQVPEKIVNCLDEAIEYGVPSDDSAAAADAALSQMKDLLDRMKEAALTIRAACD